MKDFSYLRNVDEGQGEGTHVKKADGRETESLAAGQTVNRITPQDETIHISASHRLQHLSPR